MKKSDILKETQIYVQNPEDIEDVKPELEKDDKLYVVGEAESDNENMYVEFDSHMTNEKPFKLGDNTWQYVWAKYPNNKRDIGVYHLEEDMIYDYNWFKKNVLKDSEGLTENEDDLGVKDRDMEELHDDIEYLFDKLDLSPIQQALEKIDKPIEKYEIIAKFAELIGVPRHKLNELIVQLKGMTNENNNPRMRKKQLIESIKKISSNKL